MLNPERNLPPPLPKGQRYPGSGRAKGTPNLITVEARTLVAQMMNDPAYQAKLREDFRARKVHPTIESLIWTYHLGKPKLSVELTGALDITARMDTERAAFAALPIEALEQAAADSQALMDRILAASRPQPVVVDAEVVNSGEELLRIEAGSDNGSSVNEPSALPSVAISPLDTVGNSYAEDMVPRSDE